MTPAERPTYLRPCEASDDAFLYDVFCTTWAGEVAALPNQNLAQHILRIQHIAQERRFASRHPGHDRYVVVEDGHPVGRLYLHRGEGSTQLVDLTLLPRHRSRGIGGRVVGDLLQQSADEGRTVTLSVSRRNRRAVEFFTRLGFTLADVDDLDNHFTWAATRHQDDADAGGQPGAVERGPNTCRGVRG